MKEDYEKALKKLTVFFLLNPVSFLTDKIIKNKRGLELVTSRSSGLLLVIYYLTKFDEAVFEWFQKLHLQVYASQWHHKLFRLPLSCWIWKVCKGKDIVTKIWISWEQKELFQWNKTNFCFCFWRAIIWWKNKNLIKNSGHKL